MSFLQRIVNQAHAAAGNAPLALPKGLIARAPGAAGSGPVPPEPAKPAPPSIQPREEAAIPTVAPMVPPQHQSNEPAAPPVERVSAAPMTVRSEEAATTPLPAADSGELPLDPPQQQDPAKTADTVPGADAAVPVPHTPLVPPAAQAVIPSPDASGQTGAPPQEGAAEIPAPVEAEVQALPIQGQGSPDTTLAHVLAAVTEPPHQSSANAAVDRGPAPDGEPAATAWPRTEVAALEPQDTAHREPVAAPPLAQPLQSLEAMRQETAWQKPPEPPSAPDQPQLQIDQIDVVVSEAHPQQPTATVRPSPLAAVSASRRYLRRL